MNPGSPMLDVALFVEGAEKGLGLALPIQRIACQIPFIGKVAGRQQRRFQSTEVQKGVVVV